MPNKASLKEYWESFQAATLSDCQVDEIWPTQVAFYSGAKAAYLVMMGSPDIHGIEQRFNTIEGELAEFGMQMSLFQAADLEQNVPMDITQRAFSLVKES